MYSTEAMVSGWLGTCVLIILVLLLLVFIAMKGYKKDPLSNIPGPKPIPVVGNVYEMVQVEAAALFLKWSKEYGKILKYNVFLIGTQVMISDIEDVKHVLITNSSNYKKPETLLMPIRKIFGKRSMICLPPKEHAQRRKIINPAFNTSSISGKVSSMCLLTRRLVEGWEPGSVIQIQHDLTRLSLDILGDCVFGYQFNCIDEPDAALTTALYRLMSVQDVNFMRFLPFFNYLPTRLNRDIQHIRRFVSEVIKHKQNTTVHGEAATDMLDLMIQSHNINSHTDSGVVSLTINDMIDDIILFLIAGHETATNALCWTMLELSRNPLIQERCRQEVLKVVGQNGQVSYDDCKKLVYVECCVKEALRMYPPVQLTCRENIKDDNLAGHFIPAGTVIALPLGAIMRNEEYYKEPEVYNPDRFLTEAHRYDFLPFLAGPDMCIGNRFAMLEMKVIIAVLLQNMKFSLTNDAKFSGLTGLTYHLTPPLYVVAEEINR